MKEQEIDKVMLDVKDIMKLTGMGRDACYDLMKSENFHTVKIGRVTLVHKDVFMMWLKGEKPPRKYY